MKKALISLLLGVTLVGGLVGCGNNKPNEYLYSKAEEYIKEECETYAADFSVSRKDDVIFMIYNDMEGTKVSELVEILGVNLTKECMDWDNLINGTIETAKNEHDKVKELYNIDVIVKVEVNFDGEKAFVVNSNGKIEYSILEDKIN